MPRKPPLKCPQALQDHLDRVNIVPVAWPDQWQEFTSTLKGLKVKWDGTSSELRQKNAGVFEFGADLEDNIERRLTELFRTALRSKLSPIDKYFVEFAASLSEIFTSDWKDIQRYITLSRSERDCLHELIEGAKKHWGHGQVYPVSQKVVSVENWRVSERSDQNDIFTFLRSNEKPYFERLDICTVCEKVFWVKYRGSATCGKRCSESLSRRKKRD